MSYLKDLANKLKNINFVQEATKIAGQEIDFFEDANRDQLLAGKRASGIDITPKYRSTIYAIKKPKLFGRKLLTPNLKDTGAFHRSITAEVRNKKIYIDAVDEKTESLQEKYKKTILGVSEENQQKFIDNVLVESLRKTIFEMF